MSQLAVALDLLGSVELIYLTGHLVQTELELENSITWMDHQY